MKTYLPTLVVGCLLNFLAMVMPASAQVSAHGAQSVPLAEIGSPRIYDVTRYEAAGDGQTKDTAALQRAIDAAHQAGGGTVYLPPGTYLSGTLILKSHVTLLLDTGATLLGSPDLADYPQILPQRRSYTDEYVYHSLIYGEAVEDVAIIGQGTIDGQGAMFPRRHPTRKYGERPYLIRIVSSQRIRVADVTLRDSPMWVQHYLACDQLTIDGITVHSLVNANNDGIDIDGCHDVRIANCSIVSGDDAIVLKSTLDRVCRNVTVTNCVLSTHCNGLKLGTESNGGFENIHFSNCALHDVRLAGIALEMVDGGRLDRVVVSDITMDNVGTAIFLRLGNRARPYRPDMPAPAMGSFRNVIIRDVLARVANRTGCAISGIPNHPLEQVTLSNIAITFPGGGSQELASRAVPENEKDYPEFKMFGELPAYGFYCRHARDVRMENVRVQWADTPDKRPPFFFEDVSDLTLADIRGQVQPAATPVVVLRDVSGAMVRDCSLRAEASALLEVLGSSRGIYLQGNDTSGAASAVRVGTGVPPDAISDGANRPKGDTDEREN